MTIELTAARLDIRDLTVTFGGVRAVDGVSFTVEPGEVIGLLGPNGSGKTTLLNAISGQLRPSSGTVVLDDRDLIDWYPEDRALLGVVRSFQDARLFPDLTVEDVLLVAEDARRPSGTLSTALQLPHARHREAEKRGAVDESLDAFGLVPFRHHRVDQLSTGTRRVVDLAVIAAARPRLLLLDEPTAGIAQREAEAFGPLLRRLQQMTGATIIIVEHDVPLAASLCDRLVVLEAGKLVSIGPTDEVLRDPAAIEAYLGASPEALERSGKATHARRTRPDGESVRVKAAAVVVHAREVASSKIARVRAKRYGPWPMIVLALVLATAPAELGSITASLDPLEKHFHVGDQAFGLLPFAMSFVGIFWRFLVGRLADRMKRVRLLAILILAYAALMGAQALAISFAMLVAFRVLLSFTESIEPPVQSLMGDYYPVEERGRRFAQYNVITGIVGGLLPLALTGFLVDLFGWRAVFLIWVPYGLFAAFLMRRQPEPERGTHDAEFEEELAEITHRLAVTDGGVEASPHALVASLNPDHPERAEAIDADYTNRSLWDVVKVVWKIRSWAYVVVAWTLAQVFLNGFAYFGITYFHRTFHLSNGKAGTIAATIGVGALPGVIVGGYLADWLLRRGIVNARVYVLAFSLIVGPITFLPALLINSLWVAVPVFALAGFFLSLPTAVNDAIMTDVVIPELRGRSAAAKGALQAWANVGPAIVGGISWLVLRASSLSNAASLRIGLLSLIPLYLLGGLVALLALRHYPGDLAYVVAHARAKRLAGEMTDHEAD